MNAILQTQLFSRFISKPAISTFFAMGFLVLFLGGIAPAYAEPSKNKVDWYQVEIIVFSQQDMFNQEKPRKDIKLVFPNNIRYLTDSNSTEQSYLTVPESDMGMVADRDRLNRAPGYRVLFHKAWRQPGLSRKQSPWVLIQGGKETDGRHELEGSFRLIRSRYLHVQANLWKAKLRPNTSSFANTLADSWPELPPLPIFQEEAEVEAAPIKKMIPGDSPSTSTPLPAISHIAYLNQSSRITRNDLTYLDHPNMGVIVLVKKYNAEKRATE